jgi:hypothetical protein
MWEQVTLKQGAGANLIFNVPPNSSGFVPEEYLSTLREFGAVWNRTFNAPVATLESPVQGVCNELVVVVSLSAQSVFDQVVTGEDLSLRGQVIGSYLLEARDAHTQAWSSLPLVHGRTVGRRSVDYGLGNRTNVDAVRFTCTSALPGQEAVPATLRQLDVCFGG